MLLTEIFREQNYVLRLLLKEERVAYLEGDCSRCRSKMWYKKEKKKKYNLYSCTAQNLVHRLFSAHTHAEALYSGTFQAEAQQNVFLILVIGLQLKLK